MLEKGTDYIIKAQIKSGGKKAAWCAQHDPKTYEPRPARAYEPISISGSESVEIIKFLLNQWHNKYAVKAGEDALSWLYENRVQNTRYNSKTSPYFIPKDGSTIWYRFYEIGTDVGIFGDRDGLVYYDIKEISEERRTGYSWAGTWPSDLIKVYKKYGYYPNKILIDVNSEESIDTEGKSLLMESTYSPTEDNLLQIFAKNDELKNYVYGDANFDGILDFSDASLVLQHVLNKDVVISEQGIKSLMIEDGEEITALTASKILQEILK